MLKLEDIALIIKKIKNQVFFQFRKNMENNYWAKQIDEKLIVLVVEMLTSIENGC